MLRQRRGVLARGTIVALIAGLTLPAGASAAETVVSFTFDHGFSRQYDLRDAFAARGMKATFFVNSGLIGTSERYMSWPEVHALYADGHEIGGHTLTHDAPQTWGAERQGQEICNDRTNLLNQGFAATNFSYPEGSDVLSEFIVQGCGYNSARDLSGLRSANCGHCPVAETIPPSNPYRTRTTRSLDDTATLDEIQQYVLRAEADGGWIQLAYCCGFPPDQLGALLDWLAARESQGTVVRTVQQVIGGTLQPAPEGTSAGPPPPPPPGSGLTGVSARDTIRPIIARLRLTRRVFALARDITPFSARSRRRRAPRGADFVYVLSEPGVVTFRLQRLVPGRRARGGKCRRPTRRLRNARRCTRVIRSGALMRTAPTLSNRTRFSGRIGSRRRLRPGKYRAVVTATDAAGNRSRARQVRFTVVRR